MHVLKGLFGTLVILLLGYSTRVEAQLPELQILRTQRSTITANAGEVCFTVNNAVPSVVFSITGTWVGTIEPRFKDAAGTAKTPASGLASATSATTNVDISLANPGFAQVCMLATAWTSGTATITAVAGGSAPALQGSVVQATGALTNDTASASSNRMAVLPCITLTSAPTWTHGRDSACRTFAGGGLATVLVNEAGTPYTFSTDDPCTSGTKVQYVVDIVTAATTEIANASASNKLYICAVNLVAGGAQNVAIVEDDTDACATPTAGLNGGVTADEGWNFAANGGIALPNTGFAHMETSVVNRYVCIITSAAQQLSGTIKYVLAP